MATAARILRTRLVSAILTAAGVTLLAAGLLEYGAGVQAGPAASPRPSEVAVVPDPTFLPPSLPPVDGSGRPTTSPTPSPRRVATRVVIRELGIDLAVIKQPDP